MIFYNNNKKINKPPAQQKAIGKYLMDSININRNKIK